jgi:alkylation response protein AidB-like acyl-CoA dehydrogenase
MHALMPIPYWRSDHLDFREEVRGFVDMHARPLWQAADDGSERFPWAVRKAAAEANLAAIDLQQQWGGRGLDHVSQGIAYEESGRLDVNAREMLGAGHALVLERFGTQQVQQDWLPQVVRGDALVGVGVTEAVAGSDIRAIQTRATRQADGSFSLSGSKTLVSRIHEAKAFVTSSARPSPPSW